MRGKRELGEPLVEDWLATPKTAELMCLGQPPYRTELHLLGFQDARRLQQSLQLVLDDGLSIERLFEALPLLWIERELPTIGEHMLGVVERSAANELARRLLRCRRGTLKRGLLLGGNPDLEAFCF